MGRIRRGDIIIADLEPREGSEQRGVRPVLVIQNDLGNLYGPATIIAPITSKQFIKDYPINVSLSKGKFGLKRNSTVLLNQIRAIDKSRLLKRVGKLNDSVMKEVDIAIKISLGLE